MKSILSMVIGASLACCAIQARAEEPITLQTIQLDISRQSLTDALNTWADQTGYQVVCLAPEVAVEFQTPKVKGAFTAMGALQQLLEGTPLVYEVTSERTVTVKARFTAASQTTGALDRVDVPRLYIAALGAADDSNARIAQNDPGRSKDTAAPVSRDSSPEDRDVEELEEIMVTGSHIRGIINNTAPVVVLDQKYIEAAGVSTTSRLIESLPQNFALANPAGVSIPGASESTTQGSSVNLRGLGEGTTLVLINGRRMALGFLGSAVDISALPLSAIERVEILEDGASAMYGSDAVGGVINFILRRDFTGAETRLRSGWADGGINEYNASQVLGGAWDSGNALVSVEYHKRDLLSARDRDFVPSASIIGSLYPDDENYATVFSGRQQIAANIGAFIDALYTKRDSYNEGGQRIFDESFEIDNPQFSASAGFDWDLSADWQLELSGSYAENRLDGIAHSSTFVDAGFGAFMGTNQYEIRAGRMKADGPLFTLPGGPVRIAMGADWREESLHYALSYTTGPLVLRDEVDQTVRSVFAEVYVPIIGTANARPGLRRLELSLAGRVDDYSSFGSSFDPRFGVMWEPLQSMRLRASYGTSYVAPKLAAYSLGNNAAFALTTVDPSSDTGVSHQVQVDGNNPGAYSPQESESLAIGLQLRPSPNVEFGLNYYSIEYRDRIATPPGASAILANPSSFGELIIRDPTVAQVNDYIAIGELGQGFFAFDADFNPEMNFDPSSVDVIIDGRRRNLSLVKTSGLDLSVDYTLDVGRKMYVQFGLNGTYIFELEQRTTPTSEPFDSVDTFYNPPDWRVRGFIGWQYEGWAASAIVNHTDSYTDDRALTSASVSPYTTVDMRLAYDLGERFKDGFFAGLALSLTAQNVLDEDPPQTAIVNPVRDMGFDPTNANPMGRVIAVELTKKWGTRSK